MASETNTHTHTFGPSALATPANALTLGRLLAAPILIAAILMQGPSWPAVVAWILISGSDWADGWVARRQGTTRSGAFLDPLADKCVVLGAMGALVLNKEMWWFPVVLIAAREVWMSLYRSVVAKKGVSIPARWSAKVKTFVQDLTVAVALVPFMSLGQSHIVSRFFPNIAYDITSKPTHLQLVIVSALLWFAVLLTLVSGLQYFLDAKHVSK
ncbi:MAG: CDP-alcohol phosphatidyltransferase family protein [Actinobacteria bacterium]|nr:CDP-alcohol phosphatidyltransferase family protein [Actinomycetota bacterium]MCL6104237.1 CDP-alcohol phosphatidyltransferase family protein [Actinomycetota bacterium]